MAEKYKGTNIELKHNNNVLFIEPNLFTRPQLNNTEIEYTPNLEDYCIYCDLEVELISKFNDSITKAIRLQWITHNLDSEGKNINISWLGGAQYGDAHALTTSYTDVSYKTIHDNAKKQQQDTELFGINSITINYDSWITPTIKIKFTDIRGMSLFGSEEFAHPFVTADGMTGLAGNSDITGSFFRAFFTFPYPRFKLCIKGFYGEPITYDMAVNKFNAVFDSKTGNFGADVEFVGYKFGLLNDLTMTSLAAAVSSIEGRTYFDAQIANGRFTDNGKPLARLSYLAYIYQKYKKALGDLNTKNDSSQPPTEVPQAPDSDDPLKVLKDAYRDYFNSMVKMGKELSEKYKSYYTKNFYSLDIKNFIKKLGGSAELNVPQVYAKNQFDLTENIAVQQKKDKDSSPIDFDDNNNPRTYNYSRGHDEEETKVKELFDKEFEKIKCVGPKENGGKYGVFDLYIPDGALVKTKVFTASKRVEAYVSLSDVGVTLKAKNNEWNVTKTICPSKSYYTGSGDSINDCEYIYNFKQGSTFNVINKKDTKFFVVIDENGDKINLGVSPKIQVKSNKIKTSNVDNGKLYDSYKIKEKCDAVLAALKTLCNSETNAELKKKYTELDTLFKKSINFGIQQPKHESYITVPLTCISDDGKSHGLFGYTGTTSTIVRAMALSHYKMDFTEFRNKLFDTMQEDAQEDDKEDYQAKVDALQAQYLNITGGIRYVMKSLWAHVETFLVMCLQTKNEVLASQRTVSSLNLNNENSNLSRRALENPNSKIACFPNYLVKEVIDEGGGQRMVHKYIGIDYPDLPEVSLINKLLFGASRYYNWVHSGDKDVNEGNVYKDSADEIRLAVYLYLQNFFEKWMYSVSNNEAELIKQWGVGEYFDKHFLFIDSFYNKIGNEIGVNKEKLCKRCEEIFERKTNTLMSFMCSCLQEIDCILQPTQGFMINNIENGEDTMRYYDKLFTPIPFNKMKQPDDAPYFVVIYRGDPSKHLDTGREDENDGFMVSYDDKENIVNQPIGLINRNEKNGYPIPAIGVSYGKQYQSYFIDVNVDMNVQMANEIALAAQYNIAGISTKGSSEGTEQNMHLGQDLYTVYANNSYTCTVDMMGCMWIQPLMYFQLNNVPMFRGTYMVQKVWHEISPGNHVTHFQGVRMSKYSSPFTNRDFYVTGGQSDSALEEDRNRAASYDNDCPYKVFSPFETDGEGMEGTSPIASQLDHKLSEYVPDIAKRASHMANATLREALEATAIAEDSSSLMSLKLCATTIYNRYAFNGSWSEVFKSSVVAFDNSRAAKYLQERPNPSKSYIQKVQNAKTAINEVFTKTPLCLVGETTDLTNSHSIQIHDRGKLLDEFTKPKKLTVDDVTRIWHYCTDCGWDPKTTGCQNGACIRKSTGECMSEPAKTSFWWKVRYICHQNEQVYLGDEKDRQFWKPEDVVKKSSNPKESKEEQKERFDANLLDCFIKTFNMYKGLNGESFETLIDAVIKKDNKHNLMVFTRKKTDNLIAMPLLLDILFNNYNEFIVSINCEWGKNETITKESVPSSITIEYTDGNVTATKLGFYQDGKLFVIDEENFPEPILKIIKKKYSKLDSADKLNTYIRNNFK